MRLHTTGDPEDTPMFSSTDETHSAEGLVHVLPLSPEAKVPSAMQEIKPKLVILEVPDEGLDQGVHPWITRLVNSGIDCLVSGTRSESRHIADSLEKAESVANHYTVDVHIPNKVSVYTSDVFAIHILRRGLPPTSQVNIPPLSLPLCLLLLAIWHFGGFM